MTPLLLLVLTTRLVALVELVTVGWHGAGLVDELSGATNAAILRVGPVGCAVMLCLNAHGVTNILMSELSAERRRFIIGLGMTVAFNPTLWRPISQPRFNWRVVGFDRVGVANTWKRRVVACELVVRS